MEVYANKTGPYLSWIVTTHFRKRRGSAPLDPFTAGVGEVLLQVAGRCIVWAEDSVPTTETETSMLHGGIKFGRWILRNIQSHGATQPILSDHSSAF